MPWNGVPAKTPAGQAELTDRQRGLSQRHRTALFLVDGRRSGQEVLALGEAAGVPRTVFDELMDLGMVQLQPRARRAASTADAAPTTAAAPLSSAFRETGLTAPGTLPAELSPADHTAYAAQGTDGPPSLSAQHIDLPLGEGAGDASDSSLLPAAASLLPESAWSQLDALDSAPGDAPLHEAREVLLRLLRTEVPLSGSLMMMRVRRAESRDELARMIDEIERRLRRPRRMIVVAQTLRHVRHLLSLPEPRPQAAR